MSEVLWLNKNTLEEKYLKVRVVLKGVDWVIVPDGATFATGDKGSFAFRKDGWYYDEQSGGWIETNVLLKHFPEYKYIKLFWVRSDIKDSIFTLERLIGCEVLFENRKLFIEDIVNDYIVEVGNKNYQDCARVSDLTFFTEDGDKLTFNGYVKRYYPFG